MKLIFKSTEKTRSKQERGFSELKTSFVSLLLLYQEMAAFNLLAAIANKQPPTIDKITKTNGLDASIFMNAPP